MATLAEWGFGETADPAWTSTVGGGGALDTVSYEGLDSIYFDCTGAAKTNLWTVTGGARVIAGRFYWRIKTDASGAASILQIDNTSASLTLDHRVGRKLRPRYGATTGTETAALNLDQWYLIDFLSRTDTGTASFAFSIDGVSQTGLTHAQTAADQTTFRLGNTGTNTYQDYFDALWLTDTAADYPLGGIVVPTPVLNRGMRA